MPRWALRPAVPAAVVGVIVGLVLLTLPMVAHTSEDTSQFSEELKDALERAPDHCKSKLIAYHHKKDHLKLNYEESEKTTAHCTPDSLMVTTGEHGGRIMKLPSGQAEGLQHHHLAALTGNNLPPEGESLAFLILVHEGQSRDFLERLVGQLARPEHYIMIHVDAKAPQDLHAFVEKLSKATTSGNVRSQQPPREVSWGGSSMLQVMIEGVKSLLGWSGEWKHVFVVSGSDFPVKSVDHMSRVMNTFGPSSHFEIFNQLPRYIRHRGADNAWVECDNFVYKVGSDRPQPRGIEIWGGSSWVTLSKDFSQWLTECLYKWSERDPANFFRTKEGGAEVPPMCRTATDFLDYSENVLSAEELYFQTVFMNSHHCTNLDTRYLRWVHWLDGKQGEHCGEYADWCGKSPALVELQQVRTAMGMPAFFARKFGQHHGMDLVNYIEKRMANGTSAPAVLPLERKGTKASTYEKADTYSNVPSMATDGNDYTRWSSAHGSDKEWIQVELVQPSEVCGVTIVWEHARALEFTIKTKPTTSKDPNDKWKVAYKYNLHDGKNKHAARDRRLYGENLEKAPHYGLERYSFSKVHAQQIRISMLQRSTPWGFSIFEIEVHGCKEGKNKKKKGLGASHEEL